MRAIIVIDAQNEFSRAGQRAVADHALVLARIQGHVERARKTRECIAWVQHFNRPHESPAFVPGTWGAEFSPELEPRFDSNSEKLFQKDVFGAFTGTGLEEWLHARRVDDVLLVGFFAHMCVATTAREALIRGFSVSIDPAATGAHDLAHVLLGRQTASEVKRSALLHLADMGAKIQLFDAETLEPMMALTGARG